MSSCYKRTWIDWFINQPQGRLFSKISDAYVQDNFNFYSLRKSVPNYKQALEMVRGPYLSANDPKRPSDWPSNLEAAAIKLYGLLHQRYLVTAGGLKDMKKKYDRGEFEKCPRVNCRGFQCLPYGEFDEPGKSTLKMFCPCCGELYVPSDKSGVLREIDGAYFGSSWVHLFLQSNPEIKAANMIPTDVRLFGFKVAFEDYEYDDEEEDE